MIEQMLGHKISHNKLIKISSGSNDKESAYITRDLGLIFGSGRSSGEGNGYPLQYSCLENSIDRGAWQAEQSMRSQRVGHDYAPFTFFLLCYINFNIQRKIRVEVNFFTYRNLVVSIIR